MTQHQRGRGGATEPFTPPHLVYPREVLYVHCAKNQTSDMQRPTLSMKRWLRILGFSGERSIMQSFFPCGGGIQRRRCGGSERRRASGRHGGAIQGRGRAFRLTSRRAIRPTGREPPNSNEPIPTTTACGSTRIEALLGAARWRTGDWAR